MKYEKLFKAYDFFLLFCPFTSNLFVNVKLHSAVPKLTQLFLQKCGAYLRAALKAIAIPLTTVFTRISAAALIKFPSNAVLIWVFIYYINFRTLLHLGSFITFRPSTDFVLVFFTAERLSFSDCDQVSNRLTEISGKLTVYTLCST